MGIHGREVKFKKKLPKGAEFTVVGVLESYALFQEPVLRYEVKSPAAQLLDKYPLAIDLSDDIDSSNKGLDPEEFIFMGRSHGRLMVTNARREGS